MGSPRDNPKASRPPLNNINSSPCNMEKRSRSPSPQEEERTSPAQEWQTAMSRRKRRNLNRSSTSESEQDSSLNQTAVPISQKTTPMAPLSKFKIVCEGGAENYQLLRTLEKAMPDLNMVARPNLQGQWILAPKDLQTLNRLRHQSVIILEELLPENKTRKAVLSGYHVWMDLDHLTHQKNIEEAVRLMGPSKNPTKKVLVTFKGKIPPRVNLGIWGSFPTQTYIPEPLRCKKCQRFGHHTKQCTSDHKCGVCSGRHESTVCIQKYQNQQPTRAKCPNCQANHHAWNKRCPERLRRIQTATPATPAPKQPPSQRTPSVPGRAPGSRDASQRRQPLTSTPQHTQAPKPQRQTRLRRRQNKTLTPLPAGGEVQTEQRSSARPQRRKTQTKKPANQPQVTQPQSQGFWAHPAPAHRSSNLEQVPPTTPTITISEEGLKAMLVSFAEMLASLLSVRLDPRSVVRSVQQLVETTRDQTAPPLNSTPKRHIPADISQDVANMGEVDTPLGIQDFPPLPLLEL